MRNVQELFELATEHKGERSIVEGLMPEIKTANVATLRNRQPVVARTQGEGCQLLARVSPVGIDHPVDQVCVELDEQRYQALSQRIHC